MSQTRFFQILMYLHFADNTCAPPHDLADYNTLYKIQPFLDLVMTRFQEVYNPECQLAVDPTFKMLGVCPPEKKTKIGRNKRTNAQQDPEKRNPQFNITVEVKKEDKLHKEDLHRRWNNAKSAMRIDRTTCSMQNADLLEVLLSMFETMQPSTVKTGSSSVASTISRPIPLSTEPVQPPIAQSPARPIPRQPQKGRFTKMPQ